MEALHAALCFGWIDGQRGVWTTLLSAALHAAARAEHWSKVNREVAALIAAGRMQPAGLREVERAKADGRWDAAYDAPSTATVPDDLRAALDANPAAAAFFETLNRQNRYSILHRVQTAKKPETRARRIATFVAMLERGETLYP